MTDIPTSSNLNFPKTQQIMQEGKKKRLPLMEREQSLASQQGAMAGAMTRACWGNSSVNSST